MAEWLRRGLQILARRFDSGSGLHILSADLGIAAGPQRDYWPGRSAALAQLVEHIIRNDGATGSSPVSGTTYFSLLYQYLMRIRVYLNCPDNSGACRARLQEPGAWKRL